MTRKLFVSVFAFLLALAFGTAVMAQSADDDDSFSVSVTNPYVAWDSSFDSDDFNVTVEPRMARQYSSANTFTVSSTTPFEISVSAAWDALNPATAGIEVNPDNNAIGAAANIDNAFDIQISARGDVNDYTTDSDLNTPEAGTKSTTDVQSNTLGETDDAVSYGTTVSLVLVDEENALAGTYNSSGWDSGGLDNSRFDSLPNGTYDVNVTVTISEV